MLEQMPQAVAVQGHGGHCFLAVGVRFARRASGVPVSQVSRDGRTPIDQQGIIQLSVGAGRPPLRPVGFEINSNILHPGRQQPRFLGIVHRRAGRARCTLKLFPLGGADVERPAIMPCTSCSVIAISWAISGTLSTPPATCSPSHFCV